MQKIIVILGPTASGKTALSIELARTFNGEIVSGDSRQVYRGLNIGSGKVTKREMKGIPHHLLDIVNPKKIYTASDYVRDGRKALTEIEKRGKTAFVVGGTGFYIDALLGIVTLPDVPANPELRKKLLKLSLAALQKRLKKIDPRRYEKIDIQNPLRLIRAIEIAEKIGKNPPIVRKLQFAPLFIGISWSKEELAKRIHTRLLKRLTGIIREAKELHMQGLSWKRMEELGLEYRYASRYHQGLLTKVAMSEELMREIVKYSKRQMTWFKRNKDINWFPLNDKTSIEKTVLKFLK